jgi:hypothetical protein
MATLYGVNAALIVAGSKAGKGEVNGHVKTLFDEITMTAEAANGDVLKIGPGLPKGARVLRALVKCPDLGGTGTLELGNAVGADAVEAADSDAFASLDASGQALQDANDAGAGILHKYLEAVDVELKFVGATASATGKLIQVAVQYIVD